MDIKGYLEIAENFRLYLIIVFTGGDVKKIAAVVDVEYNYDINNYDLVTYKFYSGYELEKVLKITKKLANAIGIEYVPFESRYCKFNEDKNYDSLIESIEMGWDS